MQDNFYSGIDDLLKKQFEVNFGYIQPKLPEAIRDDPEIKEAFLASFYMATHANAMSCLAAIITRPTIEAAKIVISGFAATSSLAIGGRQSPDEITERLRSKIKDILRTN